MSEAIMRKKLLLLHFDDSIVKKLSFPVSSQGWEFCSLKQTDDLDSLVDSISVESPDVVVGNFSDLKFGIKVLETYKEDNRLKMIPFMFFSNESDSTEDKVALFNLGAIGEIALPFQEEVAIAKIKAILLIQEEYTSAVYLDPLTKAHNRRYFTKELKRQIGLHKRHKEEFSLAIFDLDHFKIVNDTYGHLVGDVVLRAFADFVKKSIRSTDIFARWGGEEFVLILERSKLDGAIKTVDKILKGLKKERVVTKKGDHIQVSFSAGVSQFPDHGESEMDLINASDTAVYAAKQNGRSRVEAYYPE